VPLSLCEIFFIEGKKKKKDFELNFINNKKKARKNNFRKSSLSKKQIPRKLKETEALQMKFKLIKWHYKLFLRANKNKNMLTSKKNYNVLCKFLRTHTKTTKQEKGMLQLIKNHKL